MGWEILQYDFLDDLAIIVKKHQNPTQEISFHTEWLDGSDEQVNLYNFMNGMHSMKYKDSIEYGFSRVYIHVYSWYQEEPCSGHHVELVTFVVR